MISPGQLWLDLCPADNGLTRDDHIMKAQAEGLLTFDWAPVKSLWRAYTATFYVTSDAAWVEVDGGARYRPPCSAQLLQRLCDAGGMVMGTELLADLVWDQAKVKLEPQFMPAGPQMSTTAYSVEYNRRVEAQRNGRAGLCANVGKYWLLSPRMSLAPHTAANYGWFGSGTAIQGVKLCESFHGYRVVQPLSTRHNWLHSDESQVVQCASGECEVNGQVMRIIDVMNDPKLNGLFSYDESFPKVQT